jgi:hypothetical protein
MSSAGCGRNVPEAWCPIVPLERMEELEGNEDALVKVADVYDDWRVSMRAKSVVGGEVGIYLDRIRILMINIGIAAGQDRNLAERVQTIIGDALRAQVLGSVNAMTEDTTQKKGIKQTLCEFFSEVQFTRDIDPNTDIRRAAACSYSAVPSKVVGTGRMLLSSRAKSQEENDEEFVRTALLEATRIMLRVYIKLLSPDPWSSNSN